MSSMLLCVVLSNPLLFGNAAWTAEAPEGLPLPKTVLTETVLAPSGPPPFPAYQRANRYDVWQYYGVDQQGHFRPRVIYAPQGAYFLYNREPYPYTSTHNREFLPQLSE